MAPGRPHREPSYTFFVEHGTSSAAETALTDKESLREKDRQLVADGECSWADVNRANSLGASVVHLYRIARKSDAPER